MCRNHSHLIAQFVGEDTSGPVPVLTFVLAQSLVKIESPHKLGASLMIPTSGLLYVPSWTLAGSSAFVERPMGGPSASLFFMPEDALTTTPLNPEDLKNWSPLSLVR